MNNTNTEPVQRKPDIFEIVGARVDLRRAGKESIGLCPFHGDKHPSLRVNPEKQVWYCDPCAEGGDVIRFVQKLDGLSFPEACAALGIDGGSMRQAPSVSPNRRAAALLAGWLNQQYLLLGVRLRESSRDIALADSIPDRELSANLRQEWEILSVLHEDLASPDFAAELWDARQSIEALTADIEPEPLPEFPPLTESYRQHLRSIVAC